MAHPISEQLTTVSSSDLREVTGGFDLGPIGGQIGGLLDTFTGGNKGAGLGGQIGGMIQSLIGSAGGGGGSAGSGGGGQ